MSNKSELTAIITNLRSFAILLVVLGHSIILYDPSWPIYEPAESYAPFVTLKHIINLIQMPLFYSISGYLYYWSVNRHGLRDILRSKVLRIMIPFLIVLLLYSNPLKWAIGVPGYESMGTIIKNNLYLKDLGHLWFLPVLFFLFLLNYFPFRLKNPKLKIFFLIILLFLSYGSRRLPQSFQISTTAYYWVFFYFGGLLNQWKFLESYRKRLHPVVVTLIATALIVVGVTCTTRISIPVSLLLIPCFYLIVPDTTSGIITTVAVLSFGVYLFHSPLIYITYNYFKDLNPYIVLSINFFLFGAVAMLLTRIIRNSRFKFIVGE